VLGTRVWAADDPQIGNWKLDLGKSKYVTASAPMSSVAVVTPYGRDGISVTVNVVNTKGDKFVIQYSARYDGKPYPRTETGAGAVAGQSVTLKRVDDQTIERVVWLAGEPVGKEIWVISKDGKTRTITQSGIDPQGKPINNVLVYQRQ
jgi:hypothetical protein